MVEGLIVGMIFSMSLAVSLFFLKFWHATRDQLFLAFAIVFAIEGATRLISLFTDVQGDRQPMINLVRLIGYVLLITSIVIKNRRPPVK